MKEVIKLSKDNFSLSKQLNEVEKKKDDYEVKFYEIISSMHQLASIFESKPIALLAISISEYLNGAGDKGVSIAKV